MNERNVAPDNLKFNLDDYPISGREQNLVKANLTGELFSDYSLDERRTDLTLDDVDDSHNLGIEVNKYHSKMVQIPTSAN
jgi:hypothetical protein